MMSRRDREAASFGLDTEPPAGLRQWVGRGLAALLLQRATEADGTGAPRRHAPAGQRRKAVAFCLPPEHDDYSAL